MPTSKSFKRILQLAFFFERKKLIVLSVLQHNEYSKKLNISLTFENKHLFLSQLLAVFGFVL